MTPSAAAATQAPPVLAAPARFPRALPFIIGSEVAERFSYYGMLAILPTFLVAQFFNPSRERGAHGRGRGAGQRAGALVFGPGLRPAGGGRPAGRLGAGQVPGHSLFLDSVLRRARAAGGLQ